MAIFPNLQTESTVQVGDRTRLNASRSFVSTGSDAISKIEIQVEAGADWVDVTQDQFLDWEYETSGVKVAKVRITAGVETKELPCSINVITSAQDKLFATDGDLIAAESDIMNYLRAGRNSYKDFHREAQTQMLQSLYQQGYRDSKGNRLTKDAVIDSEQVRPWAKYLALQLIFESISNDVEDVFSMKAEKYKALAVKASSLFELKVDQDGDGDAEDDEVIHMASIGVRRA